MTDSLPPGAIPADQFESAAVPTGTPQGLPAGAIPAEQFQSSEEAYGTGEQKAKTFLEGASEGVLGSLAPAAEDWLNIADKKDILGRRRENPITHGVGQGVGLVGSGVAGVGLGAVLPEVGAAAKVLTGLSAPESFAAKVGSSIASNAAEMAVLQGSDETAKMILQDPDASAQTAMANVGMAAALGGAGGAFTAGVLSPLWKATAGPKTEQFLTSLKGHLDGTGKLELPDAVANAEKELGVQLPPAMRAGMSANPKAQVLFNELREAQHPEIVAQLKALQEGSHKAILDSIGVPLEDIAHYSENEAGHDLRNTFTEEYNKRYEPIAERLNQRDLEAATIAVPDEARLNHAGKLYEMGIKDVGTDSPYFKQYEHYAQRLLAKDDIGGIDTLKSEIYKRTKTVGLDPNEKDALHAIRNSLSDFQEQQIAHQSSQLGNEGKELGEQLLADRATANQGYAEFAKMSDELTNHLGVGDFKGAGTLKNRLAAKVSPEDLLKKFSPKGNVDSIPFLQKYFPETLAKVQQNEAKKFIRPSVISDTGEAALNVTKLAKAVEEGNKTSPEYVKFAMNDQAMKKLQAAKVLADAVPDFKSSATAGWLSKLTKHIPASVTSVIAMLMGHGPVSGYLLGEAAQRLGKDAPEAIKLALLNFMAADKPVKAEGFKAAVDFMHNTIQGQNAINHGVKQVLQLGASKALPASKMPSDASRKKLDKIVSDRQDHPNEQLAAAGDDHVGHYMPQHQTSLTAASTAALQYLQSIKPHPYQSSPLDRKIEPSPMQTARYNRALDIAHAPIPVVLQHIKEGTLQASDMADLNAMYPALYKNIAQKLSNEVTSHQANEEPIPYHTRIGISLFLGQPMDSSMVPSSILAAQPLPAQPPPQSQGSTKPKPAQLKGKSNKMYQTPGQNAEMDRSTRD